MKRIGMLGGVGLLVVAAVASGARAGSIFAKARGARGTRVIRIYEDDKAMGVGDVLTIIINEHSVVENETSREVDKASNRTAAMNGTVNLRDVGSWYGNRNSNFRMPDVATTSAGTSDFTGNADYETDRLITDRITVVVRDIMPNGNLVVIGTRHRNVDGDNQVIEIGGVVRPSDITFANTVMSDQVADFRMVVKVKGPEERWTKPGWLGRILNWLSPW